MNTKYDECRQYSEQLANSIPFMSRLKGICQSGISGYLTHLPNHSDSPKYSRFEHSILVTTFTKYLLNYNSDSICSNANLILFAACIHDIQHPAFSHATETYYPEIQQNKRINILNQPEMVQYINNMKWNLDQFIPDGGSPIINILKAPWPHINTDRLAYILNDTFTTESEIIEILESLRVNIDGFIYCTNIDTAIKLFNKSVLLATKWKGEENIGENQLFAQILLILFKEHFTKFSYECLYKLADTEILGIIESLPKDNMINIMWNYLKNGNIKFTHNNDESDNSILCVDESKLRLLDPLVRIDDQFKHLSDISDDVKIKRKDCLLNFDKKMVVKCNIF